MSSGSGRAAHTNRQSRSSSQDNIAYQLNAQSLQQAQGRDSGNMGSGGMSGSSSGGTGGSMSSSPTAASRSPSAGGQK